jgi:hypothetical protein
MLSLNDKQSCADFMCGSLDHSATWRRVLQEKYPHDDRNGRAAGILDSIADETPDLADEDWLRLRPYFRWDSPVFKNAVSQASRDVAFKTRIRTLHDFVSRVVGILSAPVTA